MKQKSLLKTMLLLFALIAGSSSVWANTQSWDLATATYSSSSADLMTWSSTNITFTAAKNGGTNVNNYLGGSGTYTQTRFYSKNILTFTPLNEATISSIVIHVASSSGGASNITGGTKTNCTASASGQDVTITPTTGTSACSVQLSGNIRVETVTVTYTGGSSAQTATATFDDANAFISIGDIYTNNINTTPDGLTVSYASGDDDIATINSSTGEVTGVAEGKVTITASWTQQTVSETLYAAGSQTYTLYVGKVIEDGVFDFTGYQNYGSGVPLTTSTSTYKGADAYVFTAGDITLTTGGESNKYFAWYDVTDDKNELRFYSGTRFTIAAPVGYAITNIAFTGKSNVEKMTVSSGTLSGNNTASTWTGCAQSVTFTRGGGNPGYYTITVTYGTTVPVTVTAAGWASYSGGVALDFTGTGVTAYIAKSNGGTSSVTLTEIAKVPASTGIVVNAPAGTYAIPVLTGEADATTGNLLKANLTDQTLTSDYYTLAVDGSGNPMFKKSTGVGTLAAGKAYLDLTGGAPELSVDFGGTTGINAVNGEEFKVSGEYYNLAGQRVAQPTKGLYIVNGKKVIIK